MWYILRMIFYFISHQILFHSCQVDSVVILISFNSSMFIIAWRWCSWWSKIDIHKWVVIYFSLVVSPSDHFIDLSFYSKLSQVDQLVSCQISWVRLYKSFSVSVTSLCLIVIVHWLVNKMHSLNIVIDKIINSQCELINKIVKIYSQNLKKVGK